MAQLQFQSPTEGKIKKRNRHNLAIDMTPMVDLGFLLVTFFVFTTTMSNPTSLSLNMPKSGPPMDVEQSAALTFVIGSGNQVMAYEGLFASAHKENKILTTDFGRQKGMGTLIRNKQKQMEKTSPGSSDDMVVLIKPIRQASYGSLIKTLDEMLINGVNKYAVVDPQKEETALFD